MKKKSRILSFLLAILILFGLCPSYMVYAEHEVNEELPRLLFKYTGDEKDDSVFSNQTGLFSNESEDSEHKNVLRMDSNSSFFINLGDGYSTGKVVISWDVKANRLGQSYARIYSVPTNGVPSDAEKIFDTVIYRGNGQIQSYKQLFGWNIDEKKVGYYKANEWSHLDMWLDLDKKVMDYYVDGEFITSVSIIDSFDKFCSLSMSTVNAEGDVTQWYDNIYIGYVPQNGHETGFDFCQYIPKEVESPVYADFIIDNIGHAFFDKEISINTKITNAFNFKKNITLNFKVYTESGIKKYEKTEDIVINEKEVYDKSYEFDVDEYGFYYVYLNILDKDTNEESCFETRFSCINGPKNGVMNEKIGFNNHFQFGNGLERYDELLDMQKNAGFKFTREAFAWDWIEATRGVFKMPSNHGKWIPKVQQNDQGFFAIVGYKSFLYNMEPFPVSESEIGHWNDYVDYLMLLSKQYGITNFEVMNETNLQYNKGSVTAEQYVRLLKETYTIIKKHMPEATVWAFCTANVQAPKFIRECLELGAGDYLDGVSIHPYTVMYRPDEGTYLQDVQDVLDLMKEFGIEDKKLCFSEVGWTCAEGFATEEEQARYSVRASALTYDVCDLALWYVSLDKIFDSSEYN